jgi:hypothetical protein
VIKFSLKPNPPSPNVRERMHWSARSRLCQDIAWKVMVGIQLKKKTPHRPSWAKIKVHATRFAIRLMDRDNFVGSLKPVIDGLVACRVVPDDKPELVHLGELNQKRVSKKADERLEITVEEV